MRVRGAPAIGIAAAYGLVLSVWNLSPDANPEPLFRAAAEGLSRTRPTAVNLFWAIRRMERVFKEHRSRGLSALKEVLVREAERIHEEDIAANRRIGEYGEELLPQGVRVLTICNTGALATGGYGTSFGVIRAAWEKGKLELVYACETQPRLQGARLTAWELLREGIPFRFCRTLPVSTILLTSDEF